MTGYFGYQGIVYVSEKGPYTKRIKRIAIMDQDGENHDILLMVQPSFNASVLSGWQKILCYHTKIESLKFLCLI